MYKNGFFPGRLMLSYLGAKHPDVCCLPVNSLVHTWWFICGQSEDSCVAKEHLESPGEEPTELLTLVCFCKIFCGFQIFPNSQKKIFLKKAGLQKEGDEEGRKKRRKGARREEGKERRAGEKELKRIKGGGEVHYILRLISMNSIESVPSVLILHSHDNR